MDLRVFPKPQLFALLRALRTVACVPDRFTGLERALIEGVARLHDVSVSEDLQPVALDELSRIVVDPQQRKRAVQLAIVLSLVEGTPSPAAEHAVGLLADALDIEEAAVNVLYELSYGDSMLGRFDVFRRVSGFIRAADGSSSVLGAGKTVSSLLLLTGGNPELAARYHALGTCRPGTLGRAVYAHFVDNGFRFPGEPGGIPSICHDLGHVLSGYGTDPHGELQQAAFQAGFVRRDGFALLLFGILQFHMGLYITPIVRDQHALFQVAKVRQAFARGAACKVDVSIGYDFFTDKDRPLAEVRKELGISPLHAGALA